MMLRDRLVCGVNQEGIQRKHLKEKNLTYDKALEITLSTEAAAKGSKDINAASTMLIDPSINYTSGKKYTSEKTTHQRNRQDRDSTPAKLTVTCYQCGGQGHSAPECKSRTIEYRRCHKTKHIAQVCRSKGQSNPKKTHYVQKATETSTMAEDPSNDLFNLHDNTYEPITVEIELNQVPRTMQLDTDASLTYVP